MSDVNLSVMTNLIANGVIPNTLAAMTTEFNNNSANGSFNQAYADNIFATYNVNSTAADPLLISQVKTPLNQKRGSLHGLEFAFQHFFGHSGFGVAGSYTFVDGDVAFNNAARLSYNWRDKYIDSATAGNYNNPRYFDPFHSIDLSVGYDVNSKLQLSFEGINLTGEDLRSYARSRADYWLIQQLKPRYLLGARYKF